MNAINNLKDRIHTVEPPPSFAKEEPCYTDELRVYYLKHNSQLYWIFDADGFLCSTDSLEALGALLFLQSKNKVDQTRPFYRPGARDFVYPGSAEEKEAHMLKMQSTAKSMGLATRQAMVARALHGPKTSSADGLLKTLGLNDGPPREEN